MFNFKKPQIFQEPYGMYLVEGSFGSGKTRGVMEESFTWKFHSPKDRLLISNVPYDYVDIYYSSYEDFILLLKYFYRFYLENNSRFGMISSTDFYPEVRWIIDESQNYFFSRDFAKFDKKMVYLQTQVRKIFLSFYIITQRRKQIDSFVRELAPESIYYTSGTGLLSRLKKREYIYYSDSDSNNPDEAEILSTKYLLPNNIEKFFFGNFLKPFYSQKYLTRYLVGLEHVLVEPKEKEKKNGDLVSYYSPLLSYEDFLLKIAPFYPFIYAEYGIEKPNQSSFKSKSLLVED